MSPRESYPLRRDEAEHARLAGQARFWSADAACLFALAGVDEGWTVADLGCGTLDVAEVLATRVGPAGRVRALDNDGGLVARMGTRSVLASGASVRVEEGDAYATGWPAGSLDATHARFLAAPAGRLDDLLREMRRLVRPGGLVLLQEPDADSWTMPAADGAWQELRALIRAGFARRGGDFDAGRQLASAMARHGMSDIEERRVVRVISTRHPYAALPLAFARQLRELWLDEGLVGSRELDPILDEVRGALATEGNSYTFTLVQCWARVPH